LETNPFSFLKIDGSNFNIMTKNKAIVAVLAVILFSLSLRVYAKSPCKYPKPEDLSKAVAEGYEARTLGNLDAQKPYMGRVRIVIEHSLAEDNAKDRFVNQVGRFAREGRGVA
jgi:hypothetical protein